MTTILVHLNVELDDADPRTAGDIGNAVIDSVQVPRSVVCVAMAEQIDGPADLGAECGHTADGNGFTYVCDMPVGHTGMHRQRTQLHGSVSTTNWGDDGLAPHATRFPENGSYGRRR
jgi:hypothetical protein